MINDHALAIHDFQLYVQPVKLMAGAAGFAPETTLGTLTCTSACVQSGVPAELPTVNAWPSML